MTTSSPNQSKETSARVRRLLFTFGVSCTLLINVGNLSIALVQRYQEMIGEGDKASRLVEAALHTPMAEPSRQSLIEAYEKTSRGHRIDAMNVLLVLNSTGEIAYSSQPSWRQLRIDDPLISRPATNDRLFQLLVTCFTRNQPDCMLQNSSDLRPSTGSFTVVRPVQRSVTDLGLEPERFLVVANFDTGMVLASFLADLPTLALKSLALSLLLTALLTSILWLSLSAQLLPQLNKAARTDGLTQLMNRTGFMELALDMLAAAEESGQELMFAILDIDHFKQINDTYGHDGGDRILVSIAGVLSTVLRSDDLVCRFGGEEFALLLTASKSAGCKALERLRLQLEMNQVKYNGHQLSVTASIGAVATLDYGYNLDYLYTAADKALYIAKNGGRNRVEWTNGESLSRLQLSR